MGESNWTADQPIVDIQSVHKSFGALEVLKGVSLSVMKGEVICIISMTALLFPRLPRLQFEDRDGPNYCYRQAISYSGYYFIVMWCFIILGAGWLVYLRWNRYNHPDPEDLERGRSKEGSVKAE